jgi:hypothetical protein
MFLRNASSLSTNYMALYPRRQNPSNSFKIVCALGNTRTGYFRNRSQKVTFWSQKVIIETEDGEIESRGIRQIKRNYR